MVGGDGDRTIATNRFLKRSNPMRLVSVAPRSPAINPLPNLISSQLVISISGVPNILSF